MSVESDTRFLRIGHTFKYREEDLHDQIDRTDSSSSGEVSLDDYDNDPRRVECVEVAFDNNNCKSNPLSSARRIKARRTTKKFLTITKTTVKKNQQQQQRHRRGIGLKSSSQKQKSNSIENTMSNHNNYNNNNGNNDPYSGRSWIWRFRLGLLSNPLSTDERNFQSILARQTIYEGWIKQYPFPETELSSSNDDHHLIDEHPHQSKEKKKSTNDGLGGGGGLDAAVDDLLDPLTAMMKEEEIEKKRNVELDLQYRKEQARRKRQGGKGQREMPIEDEEYDERAATLHIIEKDLHRLQSPTLTSNNNDNLDSVVPTPESEDIRKNQILKQVLFLYHCRHHQACGYRQGMHEVASYLLWVLQIDNSVVDLTVSNHEINYCLSSETYFMLETILTAILPAYDAKQLASSNNGPSAHPSSSLDAMSAKVLNHVAKADVVLYDRLQTMSATLPPAIYLTKWVRLIFSREVEQVLELWDAFFDLVGGAAPPGASSNSNSNNATNTTVEKYRWMHVLEVTCAARLLHHRRALLLQPREDMVHLLMNLPVETDIEPMLEFVRPILKGQPMVLPVIQVPPSFQQQQQFMQQPSISMSHYTNDIHRQQYNQQQFQQQQPYNYQQQQQNQYQQQQQYPGMNFLGNGAASGVAPTSQMSSDPLSSFKAFNFNKVKDTIASKTQSLTNRIYQEFENMAAEHKASTEAQTHAAAVAATYEQRSYDDDAWQAVPVPVPIRVVTDKNRTKTMMDPNDPLHPSYGNTVAASNNPYYQQQQQQQGYYSAQTTPAAPATPRQLPFSQHQQPSSSAPPHYQPSQQQQQLSVATSMNQYQQQGKIEDDDDDLKNCASLSLAMERRLFALQEFCMTLERNHSMQSSHQPNNHQTLQQQQAGAAAAAMLGFSFAASGGAGGGTLSPTGGKRLVPDNVWTALADLEVIRQEMAKMEQEQQRQQQQQHHTRVSPMASLKVGRSPVSSPQKAPTPQQQQQYQSPQQQQRQQLSPSASSVSESSGQFTAVMTNTTRIHIATTNTPSFGLDTIGLDDDFNAAAADVDPLGGRMVL